MHSPMTDNVNDFESAVWAVYLKYVTRPSETVPQYTCPEIAVFADGAAPMPVPEAYAAGGLRAEHKRYLGHLTISEVRLILPKLDPVAVAVEISRRDARLELISSFEANEEIRERDLRFALGIPLSGECRSREVAPWEEWWLRGWSNLACASVELGADQEHVNTLSRAVYVTMQAVKRNPRPLLDVERTAKKTGGHQPAAVIWSRGRNWLMLEVSKDGVLHWGAGEGSVLEANMSVAKGVDWLEHAHLVAWDMDVSVPEYCENAWVGRSRVVSALGLRAANLPRPSEPEFLQNLQRGAITGRYSATKENRVSDTISPVEAWLANVWKPALHKYLVDGHLYENIQELSDHVVDMLTRSPVVPTLNVEGNVEGSENPYVRVTWTKGAVKLVLWKDENDTLWWSCTADSRCHNKKSKLYVTPDRNWLEHMLLFL